MTTISESVDTLFGSAHTAYSFSAEPVSDATLQQIYETVRWAPTAMNSQPLRVAFVRSADARTDLVPHLAPGNVDKVNSAPVTAILAYDSDWHEHLPALQPYAKDPQIAWEDPARRLPMAQFNAAVQAGYFILGARAHGLAAGPMGGFDKAGVDATFFPDGRWRSVLLVNLGHPTTDSFRPRMPRLAFNDAAALL